MIKRVIGFVHKYRCLNYMQSLKGIACQKQFVTWISTREVSIGGRVLCCPVTLGGGAVACGHRELE